MEVTDKNIQNHFFKYEFAALREIVLALVLTILLYSVYAGVIPGAALVVSPILILTFFSFFFFRVIYKILDRENYDEGLEKFLVATLWFWVPANYILGQSPYIFSFLLILLYMKSQNFFMGQSLRLNPILNIILNSNFAFMISFYLFSVFMADQKIFVLNDRAILLSFALWLTYLSYRISKNMRGEQIEIETDYVSAQLGPIKSSCIILGLLLVQLGIFVYLGRTMLYQKEITLGLITLFIFHYFIYHIYMFKGREKDARALAPTTLSYGLMSLFVFFVAAVLEFYL